MSKRRGAFSRIRDALILLGALERTTSTSTSTSAAASSGEGRAPVDCLRIRTDVLRSYAEFLSEDEERDQLGIDSLAPRDELLEEWNSALADACKGVSADDCDGSGDGGGGAAFRAAL